MATSGPYSEITGAIDPLAKAREELFPPLRHHALAQAAEALGDKRVDLAARLISKFLENHPGDSSALNLMAEIARRSERFEEAERLLFQCVQRKPDVAGYQFNYALALRRLDKFEEALVQLDELLAKDPKNPLFRDQKAKMLHEIGRVAEAAACRRELLEEYPVWSEGWFNYGDSLRTAGHASDALAAYRKALDLAPPVSAVHLRVLDLKAFSLAELDPRSIEKHLGASLSADQRADLHFALGKLYDDRKLYAKSFENYAKANALRRLGAGVDLEKLSAHRRRCESVFSAEFFRDRMGWGCSSPGPIFITGLPRSGSTLLEQILSAHSAIEGLGELGYWDVLADRLVSEAKAGQPAPNYMQVLEGTPAEVFRSVGEEYVKLTERRRKLRRPFFTDKALTNFGHVGLIHLILLNAKIIDIRRHPLDCGWSCFRTHFSIGQLFSQNLSDIGRYYADYVYLMAHIDRVLPGRVHRVIYEELVADPEKETRRIFDYLGLPFEEQCLRFYENRRVVRTLSVDQVRSPLYKSGVGQWQPYEPWLGPLKAALGPVLAAYPNAPE